jgi:hypothetical protein
MGRVIHWTIERARDPSLLCVVYIRRRLRLTRPDGSPCTSNPYPSMLYVFAHGLSVDTGILGELGVVVPWCVAPSKEASQQ